MEPEEPQTSLPEEDRADIRPDLPGLRTQEGIGTNTTGRSSGGATSSTAGSGFFNAKGDTNTSSTSDTPNSLASAEKGAGGSGTNSLVNSPTLSTPSRLKQLFGSKRRRAAIGGGTAVIIGGVFFATTIVSGPLQLVHLSQILQRDFSGLDSTSSSRTKGLFRFARTGNIGETRVGKIGSTVFGKTISQLSELGIEFQTNSFDNIKSATIDTGKLAKNYPELKNMTEAERRSFLADQFGIEESKLQKIGSGSDVSGTKFAVNSRDFDVKATQALTDKSLAQLDDGKIVGAMKRRVLSKFFDLPNLFHPLQRAKANATKKIVTNAERKAADSQREEALKQPVEDTGAGARANIKDKLSGLDVSGGVSKALLVTAGMCLIRSVAGDVVTVNRTSIVLPSAIEATDKIAVGSEAQSNNSDVSLDDEGNVVTGFIDDNGNNIWQGKALQSLAGMNPSGEDLSNDYKQAFSGQTTAKNINDKLGGGGFGAVACSTPGQIIQGIAGLGLLISGVADGGASWAAKAATVGAETAGTAGAFSLLEHQFTNLLKSNAVVPKVFGGPLGGNLLAYGARETGNITARASGGIELSPSASAAIDKEQTIASQQEFAHKSFFAQMFDLHDYRSLASQFSDALSASPSHNVEVLTSSLVHLGSIIPSIFSGFTPKVAAATTYDWGFPHYGIPDSILNDPNLADPYANADVVAQLLDGPSGQGYIDKANTCFGVDISKGSDGWDAIPSEAVNPNDDSYVAANCSDLGDYNWKRLIIFIFDTQTMKAVDCYQGDTDSSAQSCTDLSSGNGSADDTSKTTSFTIATWNMLGASHTDPGGDTPGRAAYDDRMVKAVGVMKENRFDIVGLQELESKQRQKLLQLAGDTYDIYPSSDVTTNHLSENSIIWNKSQFSFVDGGKTTIVYNSTLNHDTPWVKLKDTSTGQTFYVTNTHDPVDENNKAFRVQDAKIHLNDVQNKMKGGDPVFLTGDFNSSFKVTAADYPDRDKLTYCILTSTGNIDNAYDVMNNKSGKCPTTDINAIDHIYVSNGVSVSSWEHLVNTDTNYASDHDPVVAAISVSSGSLPSGNAQDLAKQLLPYISQGKIRCGTAAGGSGPANCLDIQNTASGQAIGGNCRVDGLTPHLLGLILGLVKDDGWTLGISAICSNHHPEGDGPYAGHSYGSAADFSIQNGSSGAQAAADEKFVDDAAALLKSTGGSFGQTQCHPAYSVLQNSKFTTFADDCSHQHIRAAP